MTDYVVGVKDSGSKKLISTTTTSTGANEGDIALLNSSKQIDSSLLPSSVIPVWSKQSLTINAGNTGSSFDVSDSSFIKYYVLCEGNGTVYAFEMNLFVSGAGTPLDIVTNKIGAMNVTVQSVVDLNGAHIDITNNEAYNIDVTITYLGN